MALSAEQKALARTAQTRTSGGIFSGIPKWAADLFDQVARATRRRRVAKC